MPPKKKGGSKKKKKDDGSEPPHDPSWERTVDNGLWERPVTDLPDANTWPTWGALRERVLTACREIKIVNTASLRDAFCTELVKLSPAELSLLDLHASSNLRNFVLSPGTACPKLTTLDLGGCSSLSYVLVQSHSLNSLSLTGCAALKKVLVHCPHLTTLSLTACPELETLMIWSDELQRLDLTGCTGMVNLKLQCPALTEKVVPPLKVLEKHIKPQHPPIAGMLKESYADSSRRQAEVKEAEWVRLSDGVAIIPRAHRPG